MKTSPGWRYTLYASICMFIGEYTHGRGDQFAEAIFSVSVFLFFVFAAAAVIHGIIWLAEVGSENNKTEKEK